MILAPKGRATMCYFCATATELIGCTMLGLLDKRGYDRLGVLIGHLHQHHVTGMTLDQGRDIAVF